MSKWAILKAAMLQKKTAASEGSAFAKQHFAMFDKLDVTRSTPAVRVGVDSKVTSYAPRTSSALRARCVHGPTKTRHRHRHYRHRRHRRHHRHHRHHRHRHLQGGIYTSTAETVASGEALVRRIDDALMSRGVDTVKVVIAAATAGASHEVHSEAYHRRRRRPGPRRPHLTTPTTGSTATRWP